MNMVLDSVVWLSLWMVSELSKGRIYTNSRAGASGLNGQWSGGMIGITGPGDTGKGNRSGRLQ